MWALRFLAYEWLKSPDLSAVESTQKNLDGKSSERPIDSLRKKSYKKYNHLGKKKASIVVANSLFHTVHNTELT